MKKLFAFALILCISAMLNSCWEKDPVSPAKTSFWKLTDKLYWWTPRLNNNHYGPVVQIGSIPYGTWFHVDGWSYYIGGSDYELLCKDSAHAISSTSTCYFYWNIMPSSIMPDSIINIFAKVTREGTASAALSFSHPAKYSSNEPYFTSSWALQAFTYDDKVTGTIKISKPTDEAKPPKMAVRVSITSAYAQIEYIYIYEWVTE